jgi:hypothetical protein
MLEYPETLSKRENFEKGLISLLESLNTESEDYKDLRKSLARLTENPRIFTGDPDGIFTYDDPFLARAAFTYYLSEKGKLSKLIASKNFVTSTGNMDERLISETNWFDWVPAMFSIFRYRGDRSLELLKRKRPTDSIPIKEDRFRLALIGDAGFRGKVQKIILNKIKEMHETSTFNFLVHLGDTYFAGSDSEMRFNFLRPFKKVGPPVLAIIGNHDLYYSGVPFIDVIEDLKQPGRFFSIENDHCIVACLDTALPSTKLTRNEGALDKDQICWLSDLIEQAPHKKIILLSHHYIDSGWSKGSSVLRKQLRPFIPKIFSWYWGHEHNCATYDKKNVGYYGACIGNGVFMERWSPPTTKTLPNWFPGGFCSCATNRFGAAWQHGFLELEVDRTGVTERYHLECGTHVRALKFQ